MTTLAEVRERVRRLPRTPGGEARDLLVGNWRVRLFGLEHSIAVALDARWGGFLLPAGPEEPTATVAVVPSSADLWLPAARPGEQYRLEASTDGGGIVLRSYALAMTPSERGGWILAIDENATEPAGRTIENAARWLMARLAANASGLALHGAGVVVDGRAWVLAGPSRAGKSTAVRLTAPAPSLGDDFAIIVPAGSGWAVPAVPFDNAEAAPAHPRRGLIPLGGVLRLFHAPRERIERPASPVAHASLMACVAFPWALPDSQSAIADSVDRLVASGAFAHLHFALDRPFVHLLRKSP